MSSFVSPRCCAFVVMVALCGAAATARADRPVCAEAPADEEVRRRLTALTGFVHREEPSVRRWWSSFALLHATMLSGAIILAATSTDEGQRNELLVGVTSSTLAVASLLFFTPPMLGAGDTLRALPERTAQERLAKLRRTEDIVRRASDTIDFLFSWVPSTLSGAYVAAASMTMLLAFERDIGAFTHAIGGTILGLGRVLLRPSAARDTWRRYARSFEDAGCEPADNPSPDAPPMSWQLAPAGPGLSFTLRF